jgi:hypothetical protein
MPIPIDVPLREARTYLHSTNLFDFLAAATGARHNLSLIFRRKIECEVDALPAAEVAHAEDYPARFSGDYDAGRTDLVLVEKMPLVPLCRREPYNEKAVTGGARIEGTAIFSETDNGATPIERIVALNKRLLEHVSESQRVLVFSKVSLNSIPERQARLKIQLRSRLGLTLFRSFVFADDRELGEITFYGT